VLTVQPGDFCCVPISGYVGVLISIGEWLDGSGFNDYDHAEIFIGEPDMYGPYGYTIGAYPGGAAKVALPVPPEKLPHALWSSNALELTTEARAAIVANAKNSIGVPYSSLDYFALVSHRLHIPAPGLKDYIASSHHMICSQLVDYIYMHSGVHLFTDNRWPGYVTPADLANLIKEKLNG
jgi:hypothetical protein